MWITSDDLLSGRLKVAEEVPRSSRSPVILASAPSDVDDLLRMLVRLQASRTPRAAAGSAPDGLPGDPVFDQGAIDAAVSKLPHSMPWKDLAAHCVDVHLAAREDQQPYADRVKEWIEVVGGNPPSRTAHPAVETFKQVLGKRGGLPYAWPSVVDALIDLRGACDVQTGKRYH